RDAAPGRAGPRGRRDPGVPGHVERFLLGEPDPAVAAPLDGAGRRRAVLVPVRDVMERPDGGEDDRARAGRDRLPVLPAVLRRRCRVRGSQGMTVRAALRSALVETYRCSWRLLLVNTALTAAIGMVVLIVSTLPLALLIAPLVAGPVAAALVHCTIKVIREEEFQLRDAVEGLRLHWRRGFALGGLFGL